MLELWDQGLNRVTNTTESRLFQAFNLLHYDFASAMSE